MKDVPAYLLSGWYDSFCDANLRHFTELSRLQKSPKKVMIGPWSHGYGKPECGDAAFGADGDLDERSIQLDWFDHWLKGSALKVIGADAVRYFRIGGSDSRSAAGKLTPGGEWRTAPFWPPANGKAVRYYLREGGRLDVEKPKSEQPGTYVHDPAQLVPTLGGRQGNFCVMDQRPLQARADVLTFLSAPTDRTNRSNRSAACRGVGVFRCSGSGFSGAADGCLSGWLRHDPLRGATARAWRW